VRFLRSPCARPHLVPPVTSTRQFDVAAALSEDLFFDRLQDAAVKLCPVVDPEAARGRIRWTNFQNPSLGIPHRLSREVGVARLYPIDAGPWGEAWDAKLRRRYKFRVYQVRRSVTQYVLWNGARKMATQIRLSPRLNDLDRYS
jgi:hypothetical protein